MNLDCYIVIAVIVLFQVLDILQINEVKRILGTKNIRNKRK